MGRAIAGAASVVPAKTRRERMVDRMMDVSTCERFADGKNGKGGLLCNGYGVWTYYMGFKSGRAKMSAELLVEFRSDSGGVKRAGPLYAFPVTVGVV